MTAETSTEKTAATTSFAFTPGDLVISVYGDGAGTGNYTDNQAAPIVLQEITTAGAAAGQMVLPQTTTTNANGTTEYAISGEYGSSSEGTLELSQDGQSLVIGGYAANAATFNAGGAAVYGDARLAQSTSVPNGTYTPVARVVADIRADGTVDTSTALYNVFNGNNIRSVATVDGSSFYVSGQGTSGDTTQGVFLAGDGASSATAIDTSTDTRTVEIHNGELYVSRDSKQGIGGTSNVSVYGSTEPSSATTPTTLSGINKSITLSAAEENTVNASAVGTKVALSPENFFFANSTTLYIADSGNPKQGGLGDGGLQKWVLANGTWSLQYTLSAGLSLVTDKATAGTTGLIGLTGNVSGDNVTLYATNATIGDLDQTYVFGITDSLSSTTGTGETFTTLVTAAADTNIRGISFAPTATTACYARGTRIRTDRGDVAVEDLRVDDVAITTRDGVFVASPIVWIGQRRIDVVRHPFADRVRPVRFAVGSLADGVPSRPLVLSPDHALLLGGVLIAARQLVNGGSIAVQDVPSVQYFHIELKRHGILIAEGAEAESYLDTGNRAQFDGNGAVRSLHADFARFEHPRACAPLATDASIVQPVWQHLAGRSVSLGHPVSLPAIAREAGLYLLLADGTRLAPASVAADGLHVFEPGQAVEGEVRIRSRHNAPADLLPWLDDRRQLGVAIDRIELRSAAGDISIELDADVLQGGWWAVETDGAGAWRWSDGDAVIVLPGGTVRLTIGVRATAAYVAEAEAEAGSRAA